MAFAAVAKKIPKAISDSSAKNVESPFESKPILPEKNCSKESPLASTYIIAAMEKAATLFACCKGVSVTTFKMGGVLPLAPSYTT
mmetsp:Transcript_2351/g.3490  ORF Transcript_2351/g.3490 Transcript_2351/m.3490 type:complete len:85 (+) Transcript_2351:421-675(+)